MTVGKNRALKNIKHQIDNYTCNGDVHPDGVKPFGNADVFLKISVKGVPKRGQTRGYNDHSQWGVCT